MIHLFTDFGLAGPYVGQMHAVMAEQAPDVPVIDLMHDAPRFDPRASGYLLAALAPFFPAGSVCVAVVDPGVGTERRPVVLQADGRWFVGPDNGLFSVLPHVFPDQQWFEITWQPERLSASFHGRDLFAPVGAALARGEGEDRLTQIDAPTAAAPELAKIIYIDAFGNAMTGLHASRLVRDSVLRVNHDGFRPARTFGDYPAGTPLWYENAYGLAELSVTQGSAAETFGLSIGDTVNPQVLSAD